MTSLQDAVTLARDIDIATAISVTTAELAHVRALLELRPDDPRRVSDELEVLARLADLKRQQG